ncbi:SFT2 family protein [Thraustotheca clavata]|uniref:Vesicle transport protein n=1 Tax=Thraustotheca clavata TaxID=74557 RepID=A0A1V9ZZ22_9STRA|nr:SFT2 family protein [Thraustotheca clavata]
MVNFFVSRTPRPAVLPTTWLDDADESVKLECPSMSYENRLYAFAACLAVGAACSLFSLFFAITLNTIAFGIMYSFGSICGIFSTMFLVGPARQCQLMFHKHRWIATIIYLVLIGLTLLIGFANLRKGPKAILIIFCVVLQFLAAIWYSLSYIPYARKVVSKALGPMFDCLF